MQIIAKSRIKLEDSNVKKWLIFIMSRTFFYNLKKLK